MTPITLNLRSFEVDMNGICAGSNLSLTSEGQTRGLFVVVSVSDEDERGWCELELQPVTSVAGGEA